MVKGRVIRTTGLLVPNQALTRLGHAQRVTERRNDSLSQYTIRAAFSLVFILRVLDYTRLGRQASLRA